MDIDCDGENLVVADGSTWFFLDPGSIASPVHDVGEEIINISVYDSTVAVLCEPSSELSVSLTIGARSVFRIEGFDSYGDGWNGGRINIYADGVLNLNFTLGPGDISEHTELFTYVATNVTEFVWIPGDYVSEVSFEIFLNDESVWIFPSEQMFVYHLNGSLMWETTVADAINVDVGDDKIVVGKFLSIGSRATLFKKGGFLVSSAGSAGSAESSESTESDLTTVILILLHLSMSL